MAKNLKTPVSIRMADDELELLGRAAALFDGNKTKAMVEGLRALLSPAKGKLTKAALMAELDRRLR
jgi:hypothetical protein